MANYSLHLRFLAQIHKKTLMRELYIWRHNSSIKSKEIKDCKLIANKNIENLKNSLSKINFSAKNKISTIFEDAYERSPSPTGNVFEELKSSLNLKVMKIDKGKGSASGKLTPSSRLEKSESIQVVRLDPESERKIDSVISPILKKTPKSAAVSKYHTDRSRLVSGNKGQVKKPFSRPN